MFDRSIKYMIYSNPTPCAKTIAGPRLGEEIGRPGNTFNERTRFEPIYTRT